MDLNKFTKKSLEAIQSAQDIARDKGSSEVKLEHLTYALLTQESGLVPSLINAMGNNLEALSLEVKKIIDNMPSVSGSGVEAGKIYISALADKALRTAEKLASAQKDEYLSVEHLFVAILQHAENPLKSAFRTYGITEQGFNEALKKVKSDRVTGDNPETDLRRS